MTRCERAKACLARLWRDSGLTLTPYVPPVEVPATQPESSLMVAPERIDKLLNMPPEEGTGNDDDESGSGSSSGSSSSARGGGGGGRGRGRGRGGGRGANKAPKPTPLRVTGALQGVLQAQGVPVVKDLHRLGRADLRKRRPPGYVETAKLRVREGEFDIGPRKLQLIQRSQLFADVHNRPAILAHAIKEWRD
tara:strand:- start:2011 stop:2589 length:579 start_codon:yes stop_codon:yes gene_type:complete